MATIDQEAELSRLQKMRSANILRPHQVERLTELEQQMGVMDNAPETQVVAVQNNMEEEPVMVTGGTSANTSVGTIYIDLNVESFERGGNSYSPPPAPGIYPAVCTGVLVPDNREDQIWFNFQSPAGSEPYTRGVVVCGALTTEGQRSGAFKVKSVLDALGINYQISEKGVSFEDPTGIACKAIWSNQTFNGKTELRIQDIEAVDAEGGSVI